MKKFSVKPKLTNSRRILIGNQHEADEFVFLGRLGESGSLVRVDFDLSLPHVVAIFGKRGTGKSYTLGTVVEGLCTREQKTTISSITRTRAALLFDTLGIFQWLDIPLSPDSTQKVIQEQTQLHRGWDIKSEPLDVKVWLPKGATRLSEKQREFTVNCADFNASDWGYLFGVDILQDRMGQLLNEAYEKVVNEGWSDGQSTHPAMRNYAVEDLMTCVEKDIELLANYHSETRRAVRQQLSVYWRNPLFQPKRKPHSVSMISNPAVNGIDHSDRDMVSLSQLLKRGQLSILLMHKMADELRFVIIVSLIRKMIEARIRTSELEKQLKIVSDLSESERAIIENEIENGIPPVWILADEAQNFLPSGRTTAATDTLVKLVREGRNFGLSFIMTTQQPSAVDQRILAQVDTLVVHKLTVQADIEYVKRNLKSALPEETKYGHNLLSFDSLVRSLDVGQAIVSNTDTERTFVLDVRPRVSVHGGFGD